MKNDLILIVLNHEVKVIIIVVTIIITTTIIIVIIIDVKYRLLPYLHTFFYIVTCATCRYPPFQTYSFCWVFVTMAQSRLGEM